YARSLLLPVAFPTRRSSDLAIEGFRAYPEFFPLVYLSYYYFHNEMVAHMDPGYTRANYVLDVREKVVFADCERCIAAGTTKDSADRKSTRLNSSHASISYAV